MRKITLFTASSLDGFIAGPNDEIDWLFTDEDYGYKAFYGSIDTTLSGMRTYNITLTFGEFPYPDKENFVFTRNREMEDNEYVKFISGDIPAFVRDIKNREGKNIWLIGGGQINTILLNAGLIDEMVIFIHPVFLGKGIPLFGENANRTSFRATGTKMFESGLVQVDLLKR